MNVLARDLRRFFSSLVLFYWVCFVFPFPLDLVGLPFQLVEPKAQPAWTIAAGEYYQEAFAWLSGKKNDACTWVGDTILHVSVIIQPTGSGDTMRAYVGCLCAAVIAAAAAVVWTVLVPLVHRCKPGWRMDAFLHRLVRVLVRFFLIGMLFGYGVAKVFPLQFVEPSSFRLSQQLGDMSPMGLLWTFMGFSTPYEIFTGAVEVLGGLLLITRRTTFLGALVVIVAMTQIFALNMCFDVPVKLYSFHYLAMALFLAAPDLPRMVKALVLGRAVEAKPWGPLCGNVRFDRFALVFRTLVVAAMLYGQIHSGYARWSEMRLPAPIPGRWDVVSLRVDPNEPVADAPLAWSWLDFSNRSMLRLGGPKPPSAAYRVAWNPEGQTFSLSKFGVPSWSATFAYDLPQPDRLELHGRMDGKEIVATLKPAPERRYELMDRGFHWIQERPYNR
jgi:hypothetical protein